MAQKNLAMLSKASHGDDLLHGPQVNKNGEISPEKILRFRIDEQAEVILLLKRANDALDSKNETLQRTISECHENISELKKQLEEKDNNFQRLKTNFEILSKNHEEILKFKDEYKAQNNALRNENMYLGRQLKEQDEIIKQRVAESTKISQITVTELRLAKKQLMDTNSALTQELDRKYTELEKAQLKYKELMDTTQKSLKESRIREENLKQQTVELHEKSRQMKSDLEKLHKENNVLEDSIKSSKVESARLREELKQADKRVEQLSVSKKVRDAEVRAAEAIAELEKTKEEFTAFRAYNQQLLKKERDLNTKLRRLVYS